jgi:hypothetical protein
MKVGIIHDRGHPLRVASRTDVEIAHGPAQVFEPCQVEA